MRDATKRECQQQRRDKELRRAIEGAAIFTDSRHGESDYRPDTYRHNPNAYRKAKYTHAR